MDPIIDYGQPSCGGGAFASATCGTMETTETGQGPVVPLPNLGMYSYVDWAQWSNTAVPGTLYNHTMMFTSQDVAGPQPQPQQPQQQQQQHNLGQQQQQQQLQQQDEQQWISDSFLESDAMGPNVDLFTGFEGIPHTPISGQDMGSFDGSDTMTDYLPQEPSSNLPEPTLPIGPRPSNYEVQLSCLSPSSNFFIEYQPHPTHSPPPPNPEPEPTRKSPVPTVPEKKTKPKAKGRARKTQKAKPVFTSRPSPAPSQAQQEQPAAAESGSLTTSPAGKKPPQRSRNKEAAKRFRDKSKQYGLDLVAWEKGALKERASLNACLASTREQVLWLRQQVLQHSECNCPIIQGYIARSANEITSSTSLLSSLSSSSSLVKPAIQASQGQREHRPRPTPIAS